MRLSHSLFSVPIYFSENTVNTLIIENQREYRATVFDLYNQTLGLTGDYVLSREYNPISIEKELLLIENPLFVELNSKRTISKIYSELEQVSNSSEQLLRTQEVKRVLYEYALELTAASRYKLDFGEDIKMTDMFKMMDIAVSYEKQEITTNLINYMELARDMGQATVFVVIGLKSYLTNAELEVLCEEIRLKKINVLLIENTTRSYVLNCEKQIIIDDDLCEVKNDYIDLD